MSRVQVKDVQLEIHEKVGHIEHDRTPSQIALSQETRSHTMSRRSPLKILVASWNVGNTMPPSDSKLLHDWIPEGGGDFDVIALGLQESTYKSDRVSENLVPNSWPSTCEKGEEQGEKDLATLNNGGCYDLEGDDVDDEEDEEDVDSEGKCEAGSKALDGANGATKSVDVIVKRSRTKKSMRKMTKIVRKLSNNLRDPLGDALDYPFSKQMYLHLGDSYVLAGKVELMEMRLYVYVHERNNVCGVEKLGVPTGLGSVIGNKGGLLFKCVVQNTSLCFASCHLAAHQDQKFLDKRNSDCATILGAHFGQKNVSIDHQFDHCFWFGDLNYRVDLNYSTPRPRTHEIHCAEVMTLVRAKKWTTMNQNDQLKHQVDGKKVLSGWELPPALFPPTFKRVRHSLDEYLLERVPSYCDRVLYKSLPGFRNNLQLLQFSCYESIATSDHKPIAAAFQVEQTPQLHSTSIEKSTLVEFAELSGKSLAGLDLAGLSDPYVKFYSVPSNFLHLDINGSHPSTSTIAKTCSPMWRDDQVPKLHVLSDNDHDVKGVHLTLVVMDHDATSKDDLMGVASLSLATFCQSRPRFVPFEVPVYLNGKGAGFLTGKIRVTLPSQVAFVAEDAGSHLIRVAGCHCILS